MGQRAGRARRYFDEHVYDIIDECIVWPFSLRGGGYGQIHDGGRPTMVHHLACEIWHGPRPAGMWALHGPCNNKACFNGAHLYWGTPSRNALDRIRDGTMGQPPPGVCLLGEANPQAKLIESEVRAIRRRAAAGESQHALARTFGVSVPTICMIVNRKRWGHLE
jgi:hypothetical protein